MSGPRFGEAQRALFAISSTIDWVRRELQGASGSVVDDIRTVCGSIDDGLFDIRHELSEMVEKYEDAAADKRDPVGAAEMPGTSKIHLAGAWLSEELEKWRALTEKLKAAAQSDPETYRYYMLTVAAGVDLVTAGTDFINALKGQQEE